MKNSTLKTRRSQAVAPVTFLAILASLAASAFAAFGAPSVGYMTATNIATHVTTTTVTKAYVEGLGVIGADLTHTNAVYEAATNYANTAVNNRAVAQKAEFWESFFVSDPDYPSYGATVRVYRMVTEDNTGAVYIYALWSPNSIGSDVWTKLAKGQNTIRESGGLGSRSITLNVSFVNDTVNGIVTTVSGPFQVGVFGYHSNPGEIINLTVEESIKNIASGASSAEESREAQGEVIYGFVERSTGLDTAEQITNASITASCDIATNAIGKLKIDIDQFAPPVGTWRTYTRFDTVHHNGRIYMCGRDSITVEDEFDPDDGWMDFSARTAYPDSSWTYWLKYNLVNYYARLGANVNFGRIIGTSTITANGGFVGGLTVNSGKTLAVQNGATFTINGQTFDAASQSNADVRIAVATNAVVDQVNRITATNGVSAIDGDMSLYTTNCCDYMTELDVRLYQKYADDGSPYWFGTYSSTEDGVAYRYDYTLTYVGNNQWRLVCPQLELDSTADGGGDLTASSIYLPMPLRYAEKVAHVGFVKRGEVVPSYLKVAGKPLTNDVTLGTLTINGQTYDGSSNVTIAVQAMDYQAITNTVNAVKAEFYDEPLSVNWTVRMVNGEMKLYATTNVNMGVLSSGGTTRYTNWSTDNLPSEETWAAQPYYDEGIDLWNWDYDGGSAMSEEGGANATTLTFGYGSGFTTTRSVIQ